MFIHHNLGFSFISYIIYLQSYIYYIYIYLLYLCLCLYIYIIISCSDIIWFFIDAMRYPQTFTELVWRTWSHGPVVQVRWFTKFTHETWICSIVFCIPSYKTAIFPCFLSLTRGYLILSPLKISLVESSYIPMTCPFNHIWVTTNMRRSQKYPLSVWIFHDTLW